MASSPPNGCYSATTDHSVIITWWSQVPDANIGIATGTPGPDVVDFDCKKGAPGIKSMRRLQRAGMLAGAALLVGTPSGGWHLYYEGTNQGCRVMKNHGVDFRGAGGYVVAPPSTVDDEDYGGDYRLHDARVPHDTVDFDRIARLLDPPWQPRPRTGRTASLGIGRRWSRTSPASGKATATSVCTGRRAKPRRKARRMTRSLRSLTRRCRPG